MLWDMAYADGTIHEFEENVVWRVAELLGVSSRERMNLKHDARAEAEEQAEEKPSPESPPGPWSKP
jgi:uncharacterized tellurite resistance protein B-like protein